VILFNPFATSHFTNGGYRVRGREGELSRGRRWGCRLLYCGGRNGSSASSPSAASSYSTVFPWVHCIPSSVSYQTIFQTLDLVSLPQQRCCDYAQRFTAPFLTLSNQSAYNPGTQMLGVKNLRITRLPLAAGKSLTTCSTCWWLARQC
jgi:hypothetical protein